METPTGTENSLYQDRLIKITGKEIVFYRYYFPSGREKRVRWSEIERIEVKQPTFFGGQWRLWGSGDLRTWYPQDYNRPGRDLIFVAHLCDTFRRIGFTVEDSPKVLAVLRENGVPIIRAHS